MKKKSKTKKRRVAKKIVWQAMTGAEAAAFSMKQIDPEVVAAYPITPQTPVMHAFSQYVADGDVTTELIRVESEHSAMSACVGASAAGVRAMTATASNGLALMWEIVYIASGTRLPIVMHVVNRALSGPINIHCDHADTMGCRDSSWLQFYCENPQEIYELTFLAMKIAEHKSVRLPAMVCQDGFITSHSTDTLHVMEDSKVKRFIGKHYAFYPLLNVDKPVTYGPIDLFDYYFEHKRQQHEAMKNAKKIFKKIANDYAKVCGKKYDFFEKYRFNDADVVILTMSSTAGTTKEVVDLMRKKGKKVGLLKLTVFRPWPGKELMNALKNKKVVCVLERADSFNAFSGPLYSEIRSALYESKQRPKLLNYIFGLGGREITVSDIENLFKELLKFKTKPVKQLVNFLGVR